MLKPIGTVVNHATPESLGILALWQECISEIRLDGETNPFEDDYSHYIVIHDPLEMEFSKHHEEWNKRFAGPVGISIVEPLRRMDCKVDDNIAGMGSMDGCAYVKGLYAINGSSIYSIVPFTSLDDVGASYPVSSIASVRARVMDDVQKMVSEKGTQTILDVGCGTGTVSIDIAKNNPSSEVVGIEVVEDLVSQCSFNAKVLGIDNVSFKLGDVMHLDLEEESVGMAICLFMLHHLGDISVALENISRVLKPGGSVISIDPVGHHHGDERTVDDWHALYEGAGFIPEVTDIDGAIIVSAIKK